MPAIYGPFLRPYGQLTTLDFVLYDRGGNDFDGGIISELADTKLIANEGTAIQTGTGFVGNNGGYAIELSAAEMQMARGALYVVDVSSPKKWVDAVVFIETYGDPNSQHPSIGSAAVPVLV